jgi:hypothetical protein
VAAFKYKAKGNRRDNIFGNVYNVSTDPDTEFYLGF